MRFKTFDVTSGLPQNTVFCIFRDARGFLWMGTEEGVGRFDGLAWQVFGVEQGLAGNKVYAIAEDAGGRLWFGTSDGLSEFQPETGVWRNLTAAGGLSDARVRALLPTSYGQLWLGTQTGIARYDPRTQALRPYGPGEGPGGVWALAEDAAGGVWAGTRDGGIYRLDVVTDRWQPFSAAGAQVTAICRDFRGLLWIATFGQGVFALDPETRTLVRYTTADGLAGDHVWTVFEDRERFLWLGTRDGLTQLDAARRLWQTLRVQDGLPSNSILSVAEDETGGLWLGTNGAGVCQRERERTGWTARTTADGLPSNLIMSLAAEGDGRVWLGTYGEGVLLLDRQGVPQQRYTTADGLGANGVTCMYIDPHGERWFGTNGGGLTRFDPARKTWRTYTVREGLCQEQVWCLASDGQDRLWIGTNRGLSIFDPSNDEWSAPQYPERQILAIQVSRSGPVWLGTDRGALRFDPEAEHWTHFGTGEGLPHERVLCIHEDAAGCLWFGTAGGGLARYAPGTGWQSFSTVDGLPNNVINAILESADGFLWLSTNRGACRFDPERARIVRFDMGDGLPGLEGVAGCATVDAAGRVWIGTTAGVAWIDPASLAVRPAPCRVFLTGLQIMGQPAPATPGLTIDDSKYDLTFEWAAVDFVAPHKVDYRWRLVGLETPWSRPAAHRFARYTNLHPGDYTFQVQARNWGGEWSTPAEYAFRVVEDPKRRALEVAIARARQEREILAATNARLRELNEALQAANALNQRLIEQLRTQAEHFERQSLEDALTGLANRRALEAALGRELERAHRFGRTLAIALADIDNFKRVNDQISHLAGDEVLQQVARLLRQNVRAIDLVARFGGEEFAIVFPETGREAARIACEKLRALVAAYDWSNIQPELKITLSFGVAEAAEDSKLPDLLAAADAQLYAAKRAGKNCVAG